MDEGRDHRPGVLLGRFEDLIARGLRGIVEDEPSLVLLDADVPAQRLRRRIAELQPTVAVVDAEALGTATAVRELAASIGSTRLVLLAEGLTAPESAQVLAFGAAACLSRSTQRRDVLAAIHLASRGMQLAPAAFQPAGRDPTRALTGREAEVLGWLQRGYANAQIASELHVSVETVRTHVRSIFRKLGVRSRRELRSGTAVRRGGGRQAAAASGR
jgi:DNA-binding NarL/FixJ family response regulator